MKTRLIILITIISIIVCSLVAEETRIEVSGKISGIKVYKNHLYVLNETESNIWKFDDKLKLICKIGRQGQGPGEIAHLSDIGFLEDKIYTFAHNSLLIFDAEGNLLRESRISDLNGSIILLKNGKIVEKKRNYSYDEGKAIIYKIGFFDEGLTNFTQLLEEKIIIPPGYELMAIEPRIDAKYSEVAGRVFISNPSREYVVTIHDEDGHILGKISKKAYKKRRVDASFMDNFLEALINSPDKPPTMSADMIKSFFKTLYFPKYLPAFDCFYVDDTGNVYIRSFEKKGSKTIYEKYSHYGKLIKQYFLDDRYVDIIDTHRDIAFSENKFYYIYENEKGEYILHIEELDLR